MKISASLPDLRRPRSSSSNSTSSVISHSGAPRTGASFGSERTFTNVLLRTERPALRDDGRAEEDARSSDDLHGVLPSIGDRGSVAALRGRVNRLSGAHP